MATLNLVAIATQEMMNTFAANFNVSGGINGKMDFVRDTMGAPGTTIVTIDFETTAFEAATANGSIIMAVTGSALEGTVEAAAGGTIKYCLFKSAGATPAVLAMATVGKTGVDTAAILMPNNVMEDGEKVQISSLVITLAPTYAPA